MKGLIKLLALLFVVLLAAVVIVPLVLLAGLFVWLKLTEEPDDEALDLEPEHGCRRRRRRGNGLESDRHPCRRCSAPGGSRRAGQLPRRLRRHHLAR